MRISGALYFLLIFLSTYGVSSQCRIINHKYASVYITLGGLGTFIEDGETKSGFILRLTNNSNCAITMQTQDFDPHREPSVRDIPYSFGKWEALREKLTGDAFAVITIRGGKGILFGVPREYFDDPDSWIRVPFGYKWEEDRLRDGSFASTIHTVNFAHSWLPKSAIASTAAKQQSSPFPAVWFTAINDPNKPDWEVLPQEAKAGEVILSKRNELGILSNFAATPLEMDGRRYASVEGFWQMMLYPEGPNDERAKAKGVEWKFTREQVAQMTAFEAKTAGTLAEENMKKLGIDWVTYNGKRFPYRSATPGEHYKLIVATMRAKLQQNPDVKRILLATGDLILKPDHHGEENPPSEWKYNEIWMQLRSEIRK